MTRDEFIALDFSQFPVTFSSPNGSFKVYQLSEHIWVCISLKNSRYAKDWPVVPDYPKKFLTYIGYCDRTEKDIQHWIPIIQKRFSHTELQIRPGKKDRTGKPKEAKFFGLSRENTLTLAFEDRVPF
jgi:hypothetical protein